MITQLTMIANLLFKFYSLYLISIKYKIILQHITSNKILERFVKIFYYKQEYTNCLISIILYINKYIKVAIILLNIEK